MLGLKLIVEHWLDDPAGIQSGKRGADIVHGVDFAVSPQKPDC